MSHCLQTGLVCFLNLVACLTCAKFTVYVRIPFVKPDGCFCREIDFANESVRTLAGNGVKGSDYRGGRKGTSQVASYTVLRYEAIYSILA